MAGTEVPLALPCIYFLTFPGDALSEKGAVGAVFAGTTVFTIVGVNLIKRGTAQSQSCYLEPGP